MTVRNLVLAVLFISATFGLSAQDAAAPGGTYRSFTPADQWELGVDLGVPFVAGDLDGKPGFGGGLHVRKALDHIFSIRVGGLYAKTKSEDTDNNREAEMSWASGSAQLVVTINNLRFNKPYRKIGLNLFTGLGLSKFSTDYTNILQEDGSLNGEFKGDLSAQFEMGAGIAFRVSPKFNIGLDYTVMTVFGEGADLLDGSNNFGRDVTTFRDFLHFPHLSLNFNLGGTDKATGAKKSEPLYWANPMSMVSDAIAALEARPVYDPTDTDGDGIIDMIDQEKESPAGARVDTKGVALDSDMDKVPDYKDKEPYSPPGYAVDANGVAQVPKPITEADVNRIVDAKLANFKLPVQEGLSDWFLPIINFNLNSYNIGYGEYEKLYQVAQVLKNNSKVRIQVTGHTDQTGSEKYNNVLSYNRAKAAIEFLVNQHGIARDRLVLDWAGEGSALVPKNGSGLNRRVEFSVAKAGAADKERPEGPEAGQGRFMGNKASGY
ncbi:MAG: OmpA family protein [Saprospiraceae bacterium]|nr:OmpA family protein [Saprospiraceae bacterium]